MYLARRKTSAAGNLRVGNAADSARKGVHVAEKKRSQSQTRCSGYARGRARSSERSCPSGRAIDKQLVRVSEIRAPLQQWLLCVFAQLLTN